MNDTQKPISEQEQLRDVFLQHPETRIVGSPKFLEYNVMRWFVHAMEPGETLEKKKYTNWPLEMRITEITSDSTDQVESILSLKIVDTEDGFSAPKRITDVKYLREVLDIIDQDRKNRDLSAIHSYFSRTPDSDGTHLSEDQ